MYYSIPNPVAPHAWGVPRQVRAIDPDTAERFAVVQGKLNRSRRDNLVNNFGVDPAIVRTIANEDLAAFLDAKIAEADGTLTIWVNDDDLNAIVDEGSVVVFVGHDEAGNVVTFAVDHRPAAGLVEAVRAEGVIPCAVESWQVLGRSSAPVL